MNITTKLVCAPITTLILFGSLIGGANAGDFQEKLEFDDTKVKSRTLQQGDWLVGFSAAYNRIESDGDSASFLYANVDLTYFIKKNWSVGISTFGILIPDDGEVEDLGYAIGLEPNLRYYFQNSSKYTPYLGAHIGYAYGKIGDDSESLSTYGLHAGVLFPLTESSFFDVKLKWTDYDLPDSADLDLSTLQVLVGFKVQF